MKLDYSFYTEIFEKEKSWSEMISNNLLNIYYINGEDGITEFYKERYNTLLEQYKLMS